MSFRFNFSGSTSEDTEKDMFIPEKSFYRHDQVRCEFLNLENTNSKLPPNEILNVLKCVHLEIKYMKQTELKNVGDLSVIEETKSDLLPGKYEGGLKVWECAIDLCGFLAENNCIQIGTSVLELGCGVGLPGIVAYLQGGVVTFQDFNSEVLQFVTMPNVLLNTLDEEQSIVSEKCNFLSGDWATIKEKFYSEEKSHKRYDCIITSETLYEKCNHRKLLDLMKSALKSDGIIYLASKVHYFGVGGGILDFEKLLVEDGTFEFSTVFRTDDGVERRILQLKFKVYVK